jgi:UDP-N-acetylglucosamine--N-acetylmuramyl-(pentapeptide) pyrophosphoryl-undecaprenol N-acetylglucosamine transferase
MSDSPIVWIMAGGTGGHIMPGLAVAALLQQQGCVVRWLGNPQKMEGRLVPPAGFEMIPVSFSGVRGKGLRDLIKAPFALLGSMFRLWREASRDRPSVVVGMGGYVALPGGLVAYLRRIPIVLHEQNAIAGKTNQWLAKLADTVLTGFPGALPKAEWVGNPVRAEIIDLPAPAQRYGARKGPLKLVIIGGSLGAKALNEIMPLTLSRMPPEQRPVVVHQAGQQHLIELTATYEKAEVSATCVAFIDDMPRVLASADLLICRAGAMTVAEVAASGVAALFVPFPFAVDDHQTANAQYLVNADAAFLRQQSELAIDWLAQWLGVQTREALMTVAVNARQHAKLNAAASIAERCLSAAKVTA